MLGGEKMKMVFENGNVIVSDIDCFSLSLCLDCGQSFRWSMNENGIWHGVVKNHALDVKQDKNEITFYNTTPEDFEKIWLKYFDLPRDYKKITDSFRTDKYLSKAVDEFYGIRVLNQEIWETICSFIISQNNNIPRIKGIIKRLCENFGEKLNENDFAFPTAEEIASLTVEDLAVIRAGFRAKYIIDAAKKISSGEVDIEKILNSPIETGREELMKISGVGPKVAECVLLYSCEKTQAFPVDVWVKRIVSELYEKELPECMGEYKGIAQQYLFHWRRNSKEFEKE